MATGVAASLSGSRREAKPIVGFRRVVDRRSASFSGLIRPPYNIRMEPSRPTVLCDHVAAARGSFGNVSRMDDEETQGRSGYTQDQSECGPQRIIKQEV